MGRGARGNRGADGQGGRGPGGGAAGQVQGGFQSAAVRATPEGQRANAQQQDAAQNIDLVGDADESLLVNGSVSGGLEQSSDDEARRQRAMAGRGGPGGPGGPRRGGGGAGAAGPGVRESRRAPPAGCTAGPARGARPG